MDIFNQRTVLTVTRLTSLLRDLLEENFDQVWVEGEVSNVALPSSGHIYFTLKDSSAMMRCVMFKSSAKALRFRIEDGMSLIIRGRLTIYDQRGEYQLVCEYIEPRGEGALQLAFNQLKDRLAKEGLFDQSLKKPLPDFPRTVGIVTSESGAAVHDILQVLGRRYASLNVLLYPVRVQGEGAAAEIARAIDELNKLGEVDLIIAGRGGGSLEDLWAFNEEVVARAVYRSSLPVISAVGHETDWTIIDFVADLRAPTPSAAAEMVCKAESQLRENLENLSHRLIVSLRGSLMMLRQRFSALDRMLADPGRTLGHLAQRLDDMEQRMELALKNGLALYRGRFAGSEDRLSASQPQNRINEYRKSLEFNLQRMIDKVAGIVERQKSRHAEETARLDSLSPLKTLARGYAVAENLVDGKVIKDSSFVNIADRIRLRLAKGGLICRVEQPEN